MSTQKRKPRRALPSPTRHRPAPEQDMALQRQAPAVDFLAALAPSPQIGSAPIIAQLPPIHQQKANVAARNCFEEEEDDLPPRYTRYASLPADGVTRAQERGLGDLV